MAGGAWVEAELIQNEVGRRSLGVRQKTATDVIRGGARMVVDEE